jgi:hypothetical protein
MILLAHETKDFLACIHNSEYLRATLFLDNAPI